MKILGLIPARAGSKGIKNKNIIDLGGMPLVEHTFKFVSNLKSIHKLALSTDSKKIAAISSKFGAYVPGLRPKKFSRDTSSTESVIKHYIDNCIISCVNNLWFFNLDY